MGQLPLGFPTFPGPIPFVMITEMFLQSSRPAAFMVGGSVHWLCNFTVGLVFLYMEVRCDHTTGQDFSLKLVSSPLCSYTAFLIPRAVSAQVGFQYLYAGLHIKGKKQILISTFLSHRSVAHVLKESCYSSRWMSDPEFRITEKVANSPSSILANFSC